MVEGLVNPFAELYKKCYLEQEHRDFPLMVDVEATNNCNLSCSMCPVGNKTLKRKRGFMTGNIWHIVLKELIKHKTPVRFVRWGEPTLHKNIYDWISEAKRHGLLTHLTTNGTKLNVSEILDCGLDSIKISIHNETPDLFELFNSHPRPYISITDYDDYYHIAPADEANHDTTKDLSSPKMRCYQKMLKEMRHSELELCRNCVREEWK